MYKLMHKDFFVNQNNKLNLIVNFRFDFNSKYLNNILTNQIENEVNIYEKNTNNLVGVLDINSYINSNVFNCNNCFGSRIKIDIKNNLLKEKIDEINEYIKELNEQFNGKLCFYKLQKDEKIFNDQNLAYNNFSEYLENIKNSNLKKIIKDYEQKTKCIIDKFYNLLSNFDFEITLYDKDRYSTIKQNIRKIKQVPNLIIQGEQISITPKEKEFYKIVLENNLSAKDFLIDLSKKNTEEKMLSYIVYFPKHDQYLEKVPGYTRTVNINCAMSFPTPLLAEKTANRSREDYIILETEMVYKKIVKNSKNLSVGKNLETIINSKEKRDISQLLDNQTFINKEKEPIKRNKI